MKPIFNEEKEFLETKVGIKLPDNCWRKGSKIYLNIDTKPYLLEFKVDMGIMKIKNNNIIKIKDKTVIIENNNRQEEVKNLTYEEEYKLRKEYLMELEQESIEKTMEYIKEHPDYENRISISGGKDSDLLFFIMMKVYKRLNIKREEYKIDIFNTTNDTAQTYKHIKEFPITIEDIHSPNMGWYKWLKEVKNWFLPSAMVRNCCSTYKEGQLKKMLDKNENYILFLGMRKYESVKRSKYDWDLNEVIKKETSSKLNIPENWKRFLPIVNFRDEDVWLMILHYNIKFNYMYRLGFNRVGCLICPYCSDYTDLLIKEYYKFLADRWDFALEQNYKIYHIEQRLKWTLEEWKLGKWKKGISKEYELINLKSTKERVKELADLKGISEEMAIKYFNRKCKCCNKRLNPHEVAMNFKLFGRYEGIEDGREFTCKKHLCELMNWKCKEYNEKIMEFIEGGCNLF